MKKIVSLFLILCLLLPLAFAAAESGIQTDPVPEGNREQTYAAAMELVAEGDFEGALELFTALGEYADSTEKANTLSVIRFAQTEYRNNGVACYCFHGTWGLINVPANRTVPPQYQSLSGFDEYGLAVAGLDGKFGCIDTEGNVIVPFVYEEIGPFTEGLAAVKKNGKYGFVNVNGETVIPCGWEAVSPFRDGVCTVAKKVKNNYLFGLYSAEGAPVTEAVWRTLGGSCNSAWGEKGNTALCRVPEFDGEGYIRVQNGDGLWGFLSADGALPVEPVYEALGAYAEDLCAAQDLLWGYIDRSGNTVIPYLYEEAYDFTPYGFAEVLLPGTGWQVIDRAGTLLFWNKEEHKEKYEEAVALMEAGQYTEANDLFLTLEGYADSFARASQCTELLYESQYAAAEDAFRAGRYEEAQAGYEALGGYKDSETKAEECRETIREQTYQKALDSMNAEKYGEALELFYRILGYKDVDTLLTENEGLCKAAWIPGYYVRFGTYEQDNDPSDGAEPIEWLVLDRQEDKALLISRFGLDCRKFNNKPAKVNWEKCSLRAWLNKDFLNAAFSREEQALIQSVTVDNGKTQGLLNSKANGGKNTKDKVFLLSYAEAEKYFAFDADRLCEPTSYAVAQGVFEGSTAKKLGAGACMWWLRSPGFTQDTASCVRSVGARDYYGVERANVAIRPVLWVTVEP